MDIDGNSYPVVTIGVQHWMAANLRTTRYRDSTLIAHVMDNAGWISSSGKWCNYDNNSSYDATYGKLYNWYAAANPDICPLGWHVPTDAEWTQLSDTLEEAIAGGKLKDTEFWNAPNTDATNESGFTGRPGGARSGGDGAFYGVGDYGFWWSASEDVPINAWARELYFDGGSIGRMELSEYHGFCVRCLQD